ncbi:glycosyltransferase family 2 protein [Microvirga calopogonii]|uniref:glycosyltransferase family 2 protein n=1 Tax=Microvirga calopogonii TaxID=2078013 RepID=UPI000E0DDF9E|nr:glycosyltransferase family 2 protein [Microvirga calopogonii]
MNVDQRNRVDATEYSSGGPELSFVIPVYGSPQSLEPLCERIAVVCRTLGVSHEVILVDDRCPVGSWEAIKRLVVMDPSVLGMRLSRNFGQHAAINAGLSIVRGEWVVVMDCDLQDQPEEVPAMLGVAKAGSFDIVRARRGERNDPLYRRALSKIFYAIFSFLTNTHQSAEIANFGIYHKRVIEAVNAWQEESKYFPAIIEWIGFSQSTVAVSHSARFSGKSSYSFRSLFRLGLNVVVGFSDRPLKLMMYAGLIMAIASFLLSLIVLVIGLMGLFTAQGWASIILSIWFLAGSILFGLGLTGLYIGRILIEAKGRPTFIVDTLLRGSRGQA